ncbi:hypothetical protein TNCT_353031 [Trichonephila clavata]|uniref:Uncharacterized protein n=1 Tax=Trichonephila clavata TaxID=2740835 RepID=A0A8X6ISC0_TRICU|nr:hypothetical protein TNCT_353031 [Trichonephila clavata]
MRFTAVLYKVNYHRHFQRVWKRQSRLQATNLEIPEVLKEMGVPIKDAKEILTETQRFNFKNYLKVSFKKAPGNQVAMVRKLWSMLCLHLLCLGCDTTKDHQVERPILIEAIVTQNTDIDTVLEV